METLKQRLPRIAFIDTEKSPSLGYVWGKYDQNVIEFEKSWYLLSFANSWLDEKKTKTYALPDYKSYTKDRENDKELCKDLWKILDEADIVVAHNGNAFDVKVINARFLVHGLTPPSPYKTIDTLLAARRAFKFDSNKLDDLGKTLGLGRKLAHTGFHTWKGCMQGCLRAWKVMKRYNAHDVVLLKALYLKILPWIKNHPDLRIYYNDSGCPHCLSRNVQRRGFRYSLKKKYQAFFCKACGAWFQGEVVK